MGINDLDDARSQVIDDTRMQTYKSLIPVSDTVKVQIWSEVEDLIWDAVRNKVWKFVQTNLVIVYARR